MKKFMSYSFAITLLTTLASFTSASEYDLCICQTGSFPKNQIAFFKSGCVQWNAFQKCQKKIIVDQEISLEKIIASEPQVRTIKLGYVGHWSSAKQTTNFLKSQVVPVIQEHNVSFDIDNTACLATNNPFVIKNYLAKLDNNISSNIQIRGNQVVSTGGWDSILPQKTNLWSSINGESLEVIFPLCKNFVGKACLGAFQQNARGICFDQEKNRHQFLMCLGKNDNSKPMTHHEWKPIDLELKIEEKERGSNTFVIGLSDNNNFDRTIEIYGKPTNNDLARYQKDLEKNGIKKGKVVIKSELGKSKTYLVTSTLHEQKIAYNEFQTNDDLKDFVSKTQEDVVNLLIENAK